MKKIFADLFSILLFCPCFAQQNKDTVIKKEEPKIYKFSIGGSIGYGIPTEDYGPGPIFPNYGGPPTPSYPNGYANPGIHFNFDINYQISFHWGILVEIASNNNPFDPVYSYRGGYNYLGEYLCGVFYSITFLGGNVFETKLAMGAINLNAQGGSALLGYGSPLGFANRGSGWGTELGVEFKKHIANKIYFTFEIAYSQAQILTAKNYGGSYFESGPIGILTGEIGIEFKF
jgi:hypothetical protein